MVIQFGHQYPTQQQSLDVLLFRYRDGNRGSCKIALCIFSFLNKIELVKYNRIHTFSGCCGGQNSNKIVIYIFIYVTNTTPIQSWTHTFLESGTAFCPMTQTWEKLKKIKNKRYGIYFDQWLGIIKYSNFNVIEMKKNLFLKNCRRI